jgi:hypothetical protein
MAAASLDDRTFDWRLLESHSSEFGGTCLSLGRFGEESRVIWGGGPRIKSGLMLSVDLMYCLRIASFRSDMMLENCSVDYASKSR